MDLGEHNTISGEIHTILGIVDLSEHDTICGRSMLLLEPWILVNNIVCGRSMLYLEWWILLNTIQCVVTCKLLMN